MKALCVIDIQDDFLNRSKKYPFAKDDVERLIANANLAIDSAKRNGIPVIYVRQVSSSLPARIFARLFGEGLGIRGNPGVEIDSRIKVVSKNVFDKELPSAFSNRSFESHLRENKIDELLLVGIDACHCINATCSAGLKRGFKVSIIEPAIATSAPASWPEARKKLTSLGAVITEKI